MTIISKSAIFFSILFHLGNAVEFIILRYKESAFLLKSTENPEYYEGFKGVKLYLNRSKVWNFEKDENERYFHHGDIIGKV